MPELTQEEFAKHPATRQAAADFLRWQEIEPTEEAIDRLITVELPTWTGDLEPT